MYCISRFVEGISLNGKEYVLTAPAGEGGEKMTFATPEEANDFLIEAGAHPDAIGCSLLIEEHTQEPSLEGYPLDV